MATKTDLKEFHFTIMSIDPDENEDDNHQKYSQTGYGKNEAEAKVDAKERFTEEYGLPIYWIK